MAKIKAVELTPRNKDRLQPSHDLSARQSPRTQKPADRQDGTRGENRVLLDRVLDRLHDLGKDFGRLLGAGLGPVPNLDRVPAKNRNKFFDNSENAISVHIKCLIKA